MGLRVKPTMTDNERQFCNNPLFLDARTLLYFTNVGLLVKSDFNCGMMNII